MKRGYGVLVIAMLVVMAALGAVNRPLTTAHAPLGILSFEFAATPQKAALILGSWSSDVRLCAAFGLGLDFLFLVLYALVIGIAVLWAAERLASRSRAWRSFGHALAYAQGLAALFDAVENTALFVILRAPLSMPSSPWPEIAAWCAAFKFALVSAGIFFALAGWLVRLPTDPLLPTTKV